MPETSLSHFFPLAQMVHYHPQLPLSLSCAHVQATRYVGRRFVHRLLSSKEKVFIHYNTALLSRTQYIKGYQT